MLGHHQSPTVIRDCVGQERRAGNDEEIGCGVGGVMAGV